jgi:hypothetical protein
MSPRQVKLQRMEPSPPYTIAVPLRDQVATNFRHELFQFHQLLRDAIETSQQEQHEHGGSKRTAVVSRDRRLLDLLTSDRGDAVLKAFFAQWQRFLKSKRVGGEPPASGEQVDGSMLWEVLETFFTNLPFVVSEEDTSGAGSPKAFLRYVDSLNSLRDLLHALLFKPHRASDSNDQRQDDSEEDSSGSLQSSIGLGFGLNFGSQRSSQSARPAPSTDRSKDRTPFYLYCQELERELEILRRRMPHRRPRSPGVMADILGDVGLLQDNTVMLLLDFWGLPHEERLAFFCQIASQASEQDASAILHVFLDNCTTQTFLQVWEALQQSPQFQKILREAKLQLEPVVNDGVSVPATEPNNSEKEKIELESEKADVDKPLVWRGSQRRKRGRRSTRFVDLNGITEAFDFHEDGDGSSDENEDEAKNTRGDKHRESPRFQKVAIRERGRLSLSDASDHAEGGELPSERRQSLRHSDRSRRKLKSRDADSLPLLDRLHENLTDVIKMESGPDARVMDAIWQLLEALDGHRMHDSRSGYHRHVPLPAPAAVVPVQAQQQVVVQNLRISLRTPLSPEQQFLMKLDQLQSMLVALGDVRVHTMSTETITGAYRRIPILAKLFATLTDTSLGAAGVDTAGGISKIVNSYGKAQHLASSWQGGISKEKPLELLPISRENSSGASAADSVREDVEAMSLLLAKFSKFVRSLAPLVDNEDSAPSSVSASDDVLVVMDLADKLESAGALAEAPPVVKGGGGKRRLSLAVDRELPIILAVQSLARSNDFDVVSELIATSIEAKMVRVRIAATEAKSSVEDDDDDAVTMEGDEEVKRIVKNLRRASAKATQVQEAQDQLQLQLQGGQTTGVPTESEATSAALRLGKGDIPSHIKNAAALRGVKLFSVDILVRIINQVSYQLGFLRRRAELTLLLYAF